MAGPITFHVRDCPLATAMQAGVVACADARICGVEVVECRRERRKVISTGLAALALQHSLGFLS